MKFMLRKTAGVHIDERGKPIKHGQIVESLVDLREVFKEKFDLVQEAPRAISPPPPAPPATPSAPEAPPEAPAKPPENEGPWEEAMAEAVPSKRIKRATK